MRHLSSPVGSERASPLVSCRLLLFALVVGTVIPSLACNDDCPPAPGRSGEGKDCPTS